MLKDNLKMLFWLTLGVCLVVLAPVTSVSSESISENVPVLSTEPSLEPISPEETNQIEAWSNELEYILTYLFEKDNTGRYQPKAQFYFSQYSEEEKEGISRFVMALNGEELTSNTNSTFRNGFTDWAGRCFRDTFNIGHSAAMEIAKEIEKGNYLGAATKLFTASKIAGAAAKHPMVSVAAALVYLSFCGPMHVS